MPFLYSADDGHPTPGRYKVVTPPTARINALFISRFNPPQDNHIYTWALSQTGSLPPDMGLFKIDSSPYRVIALPVPYTYLKVPATGTSLCDGDSSRLHIKVLATGAGQSYLEAWIKIVPYLSADVDKLPAIDNIKLYINSSCYSPAYPLPPGGYPLVDFINNNLTNQKNLCIANQSSPNPDYSSSGIECPTTNPSFYIRCLGGVVAVGGSSYAQCWLRYVEWRLGSTVKYSMTTEYMYCYPNGGRTITSGEADGAGYYI